LEIIEMATLNSYGGKMNLLVNLERLQVTLLPRTFDSPHHGGTTAQMRTALSLAEFTMRTAHPCPHFFGITLVFVKFFTSIFTEMPNGVQGVYAKSNP
jgi:hypothetical protein